MERAEISLENLVEWKAAGNDLENHHENLDEWLHGGESSSRWTLRFYDTKTPVCTSVLLSLRIVFWLHNVTEIRMCITVFYGDESTCHMVIQKYFLYKRFEHHSPGPSTRSLNKLLSPAWHNFKPIVKNSWETKQLHSLFLLTHCTKESKSCTFWLKVNLTPKPRYLSWTIHSSSLVIVLICGV